MTARASFRLLTLFGSFIICLGLLSVRLVFVQGVGADKYHALAADQRERRVVLEAQRGSIFDRDGAELAMSLEMRTVYAHPRYVADPARAAVQIAPILQVDQTALTGALASDAAFVYLARKVPPEVAERVKALDIPGIGVVAESKRFYPAGALASHVLGFVGTDNAGLGGLEGRYEKLLRGTPGILMMERDPNGRPIPAGKSFTKPPSPGTDVVLTIDREIQFAAENALAKAIGAYGAKGGSILVMHPASGEILALANFPMFDPNDVKASTPEARKNRALVDVYEPGSANKLITASAAIQENVVRPADRMSVPDNYRIGSKVFHDSHPHPVQNLSFAEVIQQSSNVGTIKVAQKLGKEKLHEYLVAFGYGRPSGLDFPGEARGILPDPASWSTPSIGTIPIGQGVAVTGIQIMNVFCTVANGGVAVQPRLVKATIDAEGKKRVSPPAASRRVIAPETAAQVNEILTGVTEGKSGTGHLAAVPGYQVAGKTGTAQKPLPDGSGYGGYIGSFIGYAPAGDPQLVVGVILDEPTPIWGGVTAAPTFKEVMQFSLRHLGIGPGPLVPVPDPLTPAQLKAPPSIGPKVPPKPVANGTAE